MAETQKRTNKSAPRKNTRQRSKTGSKATGAPARQPFQSFVSNLLVKLGLVKPPKKAAKKSSRSASSPSRKSTEDTRTKKKATGTSTKRAQASEKSAGSESSSARRRKQPSNNASEKKIKELLDFQGKVLTVKNGPVKANPANREMIAILDDGTAVIAKGDPKHPLVSETRFAAEQGGFPIKREFTVDREIIARIYESANARDAREEMASSSDTKMQKHFLQLMQDAITMGVTDVHVVMQRHATTVDMRQDGSLVRHSSIPSSVAADMMQAAFAMADESDSNYRPMEPQGARVSEAAVALPIGIQSIRLQFNPTANGGRHMVARILPTQEDADNSDIDTLGYNKRQIEDIKAMRRRPFGLAIIAGPTGSGKSTTLQKSLTALMHEKRHEVSVQTIEDPPEYIIPGAIQIPVTNAKTDAERREKFTQTITAVLRSDPDYIMIGEVRDPASSSLAFQGARTGHGVWTSIHANDALDILDRFRDLGVEEYKFTNHKLVIGLIGQRLVRRLCSNCKLPLEMAREYDDDRVIDSALVKSLTTRVGEEHLHNVHVANPNGCEHCNHGYTGRTVISETVLPDAQFMAHIKATDYINAHKYWCDELKGVPMISHAVEKMLQGLVSPQEIEAKISSIEDFDPSHIDRLEF